MIALLDEYKTHLSVDRSSKTKRVQLQPDGTPSISFENLLCHAGRTGYRDNKSGPGITKVKENGPSTVMPVSKTIVFKLLNSVDRSTWMENRNYLILSYPCCRRWV